MISEMQFSTPEKLDKLDKLEKPEKLDKLDKLEKLDKLDKLIKVRAVVSKRGVDDGNQKGGGFPQPAAGKPHILEHKFFSM